MGEEGYGTRKRHMRVLISALSFMAGFTLIFVLLGVFAGTLGAAVNQHQTTVNIVAGSIVVLFGLGYMRLFKIPQLKFFRVSYSGRKDGLKSFFFGIVFSVSGASCISAFLGPALLLAATSGTWHIGALLLLFYSLGLGLPLIVSALLIDSLKGTFDFIKRNYTIITRISGILLILMGLLIMSGQMVVLTGYLTNLANF